MITEKKMIKRFLRLLVVMMCLPVVSEGASLSSGEGGLKITGLEPTVLYINGEDGLMQAVDITIKNNGQPVEAWLDIGFSSQKQDVNLGIIKSGTEKYRFYIQEILDTTPVQFELRTDNGTGDRYKMEWTPGKHWEVCMVPIVHHDLGYTNPIEFVRKQYRETYEDVVHFCEETDPLVWDYLGEVEDYPEEARFRYTAEASWSLEDFIEHSDEKTLEKLSLYLKEGSVEVQALYGQMVTGILSHEEMIRQMYPSFRITEKLGGEVKVAAITDIPGFSWALPTVLNSEIFCNPYLIGG